MAGNARSAARWLALGMGIALLWGGAGGCGSAPAPDELAIANGDDLVIAAPDGSGTPRTITRYNEIFALDYSPDGSKLALAECHRYRVIELESGAYGELGVPMQGNGCPRNAAYSADGASLAGGLPMRPDPSGGQWFGHLVVDGPESLDRSLIGPSVSPPSPAMAWRPGGAELAAGSAQGVKILGTGPGFPELFTVSGVLALSLGYSVEGSRLIVGKPEGFVVLDAANSYAIIDNQTGDAVFDVAVDPRGQWIALVRNTSISIRRAPDLVEVAMLPASGSFRDASFSPDGTQIAVAESQDQVRRFQVPSGAELTGVTSSGALRAVDWRPSGASTIPVLFVHGHSGDSGMAWFETGGGTASFAGALAANPQLGITAFYLELPTHGTVQHLSRSIAEDAQEILAAIEGGLDSHGATQVGILNLPAWQALGKVAIVAYSQGTLSSRYYLKNLMGSRKGGAITVSEFVALAAPNHGIGGTISCGDDNEPDRARRQLCGGISATLLSQAASCGNCGPLSTPPAFNTNFAGDESFITELNEHDFEDDCDDDFSHSAEAPRSRPTEAGGVLYANFFAIINGDGFVGGNTQSLDCVGRRQARNHAPDAENRQISGLQGNPAGVHANLPHHWETICMTLRTVVDQQTPASQSGVCAGLTHP